MTLEASTSSFVFDGTNSDIAKQLYIRHQAGDTDDKVSLNSVPTAVTNRLGDLNIKFEHLPGLVQRAVLWDTGFAISPSNDPVQIWTMDDYTMADIAVPKDDVSAAGCTFKNCSQPNDELAYYTLVCSGEQMLSVARCIVDTFEDDGAVGFLGVMWTQGGDPDMMPQIRLRDHSWTDPVSSASYSVYAVHTAPSSEDATWNQCPVNNGYASLAVPCHRRDEYSDEEMANMTTPSGSAWVTTWLEEEFASECSGFNLLLLLPVVLGIVVIAAVTFGWYRWRRRATKSNKEAYVLGDDVEAYWGEGPPEVVVTSHFVTLESPSSETHESSGSNTTLQILLDSHYLQGKRIPYESLKLQTMLSKGASGEVWVCEFNGHQVAAKRLRQNKNQKADKVQTFAEEIELTASLTHPHIVEFVGVSWNSLNDLVMVLEYVPKGSLQTYLEKNAGLLSWARDKIFMVIGIAQALEYLHGYASPLIHRDLKSTNILLTSTLEPKLIDFGVSRGTIDFTMTAGVGTSYWTAPEILEGKRYTKQADIYSFGVVLTELDTGKMPYYDVLTKGGSKLKPVRVLQNVVSGSLQPSFSEECPHRIMRVGSACLNYDPSRRPTARQLVKQLGGDNCWGSDSMQISTLVICYATSRFQVAMTVTFIIPRITDNEADGRALVLVTVLSMVRGYTITLRSLESTSSFVFDGTNSDIAKQLYIRHQAGDTDDKVSLNLVPIAVINRLGDLNIKFEHLPGLVQRAVLWDTGFAISPSNDPVQIWTMDDYTMADIAVPKDDISAAGCTFKNCSQPNDELSYYTLICSGTQMVNVSRCVADTFVDSAATSYMGSMWSVGGDPDMAPHIRLRDHSWVDPVTKVSYSVFAIHTTSVADDPAWNVCPAGNGYGALTVPCHRRDEFTDDEMVAMNTPTGSEWVTAWLEEEFAESSGFDMLLLIPIILGVVALFGAIGFGWFYWKRKRTSKVDETMSTTGDLGGASPPHYLGGSMVLLPKNAADTPDTVLRPTVMTTQGSFISSHAGAYESAGSCRTLKILLESQHLQDKRMPYESITYQSALSKGSSGEVWVCLHNGQQVAVKRLLQTKEQKAENVQAFAQEIELTASLDHPHIVGFIGVAWNTLNNLVMVIEYVPMGSLQTYLHQNADLLSWAKDKIHMAVSIAQALEYLHGQTPSLIHRDLKSNNILLTHMLEPKLIDFGVSRGTVNLTMTAGVGTPYWTAPEILEGKRYTEQADIYSFGVVLSELDTGKIPYHDALTENGGKVKPVQILQDVVAGTLRPSFSKECPPPVHRVGTACLAQDPSSRPTAQQLIQELEGEESKRGDHYAL
ncbi:Protein kinase [Phytophthora palmivora]|uniref:Protein kinase n=1 Tax=Phytophthora palmivora TaxID=4796 RepID=A0A2P4YMK7_9STRA|nr:Protein kinase [Phytophthora palmivora]